MLDFILGNVRGGTVYCRFYGDVTLVPVIRILSLTIVISGVKGIQQAYVSRNMLFKKIFLFDDRWNDFFSSAGNCHGVCRIWNLGVSRTAVV